MGKKPATKAKAKAKAVVEKEEEPTETPEQLEAKRIWKQRRDALKWAQANLEAVRAQVQAAQKRGNCDWLLAAHEFHEVKLIRLCKRLEEKALDSVPQELRDRLEAYLSRCASTTPVEQESFQEDRDMWAALEVDGAGYVRKAEPPGAEAVAEELKAWTSISEEGVAKFAARMKEHLASPSAQEAGLVRLGGLFSEVREGLEGPGLTCAALFPTIEAAMKAHVPDPGVQRAACAALRGLAMAPGQLALVCDAGGVTLIVDAVNTHFKDKEVALAANGAFSAMANLAGRNSPEVATMRVAKVVECLLKVMTHHAWDQTLCGRVRVTLPFITED